MAGKRVVISRQACHCHKYFFRGLEKARARHCGGRKSGNNSGEGTPENGEGMTGGDHVLSEEGNKSVVFSEGKEKGEKDTESRIAGEGRKK